jgi:hypothetical protein
MFLDPPDGWRYGFPRRIPVDIENNWAEIEEWVIACGYPEEKRHLLQYCRMWKATSGFLRYEDCLIDEDSWY